jgi:hypothetical protein
MTEKQPPSELIRVATVRWRRGPSIAAITAKARGAECPSPAIMAYGVCYWTSGRGSGSSRRLRRSSLLTTLREVPCLFRSGLPCHHLVRTNFLIGHSHLASDDITAVNAWRLVPADKSPSQSLTRTLTDWRPHQEYLLPTEGARRPSEALLHPYQQ